MKKVFQTRVSKENGNCAQAVIASLFELRLEEVPDFVSNHHIKPMAAEIVKSFQFDSSDTNPLKVLIFI